MRGLHDERGSVAPFLAVISFALVMVAGLAYDGGQVIAAQARARDLAGNAARAGAQEVDIATLRSTGRAALASGAAAAAARAYLLEAGADGEVVVLVDRITVTVRLRQPMAILPLADRTIVVSDTATAVAGFTGNEEAA